MLSFLLLYLATGAWHSGKSMRGRGLPRCEELEPVAAMSTVQAQVEAESTVQAGPEAASTVQARAEAASTSTVQAGAEAASTVQAESPAAESAAACAAESAAACAAEPNPRRRTHEVDERGRATRNTEYP